MRETTPPTAWFTDPPRRFHATEASAADLFRLVVAERPHTSLSANRGTNSPEPHCQTHDT